MLKRVGKRRRLVALFYEFDLETSGKKYDRLVELATKEEICISTQQAMKIMKKWFQYKSISD
jgi:hypothetical protein